VRTAKLGHVAKGASNVYRYKRVVLTEECGKDGRVLSEDKLQVWTR